MLNLLQVLLTRIQKRGKPATCRAKVFIYCLRFISPLAYKFCHFSFHTHHSSSLHIFLRKYQWIVEKSCQSWSWQTNRLKVRETQTVSFYCSSKEITFFPIWYPVQRAAFWCWRVNNSLQKYAIKRSECLISDRALQSAVHTLCEQRDLISQPSAYNHIILAFKVPMTLASIFRWSTVH